ncbi:hypothetical protein JCM5350_000880 [Sporobolomyces pararoseus]
MLCSRRPNTLLNAFSRPAKRRCLSSSQNRSIPQPPYKILFFGADKFSCVTLETLYAARKDLIQHLVVVTPPDQRTGRKLKQIHRPPLRTLAESLSVPSISLPPTLLKDWQPPPEFLPSSPSLPPLPSSLLLTASFGHLLPTSLLSRFQPLNCLNLHPSILPNYRGAAPIQWSIINGDADENWKNKGRGMGVTVQELSREKFDRGRILGNEKIIVPENSDFLTLEPILAKKGGQLLIRILKDLQTYQENSKPQDPLLATSAPKLKKETSKIDWNRSTGIEITRLQRGVGHQYPLWTYLPSISSSSSSSSSSSPPPPPQGKQQLQLILSPIPSKLSLSNLPFPPSSSSLPQPGSIFRNPLDKSIYVSTKPDEKDTLQLVVEGDEQEEIEVVKVLKIKKEGGKWIDSKDWWNGMMKRKSDDGLLTSRGWIQLE